MSTTTVTRPQPPPLLLTKPLTTFLSSKLTPFLPTAMLITPTGKILAYASKSSSSSSVQVSKLRTQATVAASMWSVRSREERGRDRGKGGRLVCGVDETTEAVVRKLRCGMLFVGMGGVEERAKSDGKSGRDSTSRGERGSAGLREGQPDSSLEDEESDEDEDQDQDDGSGDEHDHGGSRKASGKTTQQEDGSTTKVATPPPLSHKEAEELANMLDESFATMRIPENA